MLPPVLIDQSQKSQLKLYFVLSVLKLVFRNLISWTLIPIENYKPDFFRFKISFIFNLTVSYLYFGIEVKNGRVKNDPREGRVQTCSRQEYAEELKL